MYRFCFKQDSFVFLNMKLLLTANEMFILFCL